MKKWIAALLCSLLCVSAGAMAAPKSGARTNQAASNGVAQMRFLGKFNAGVPNAGIYKMYDASDDVVCYILMPDIPETTRIPQGVMYNGNSIGSISCVKVKLHVVPMQDDPFAR